MNDWGRILKNLASRKFMSMVAVVVSSALILFRVDTETITQVVALITSLLAVVAYVVTEGAVDAAAAKAWSPETLDVLASVEEALREKDCDE